MKQDPLMVRLQSWALVMWSTSSFPLLPVPQWPGMVAPDRVLSKSQVELFDIYNECKQITYIKSNFKKKKSLTI